MLEMDLVHRIRQKVLVEGLSSRRAALDLDVSRNTVKKYTHPSEPLPEPPRGDPRFAKIRARLGELILEWQPNTSAKQPLTAARLHQQLLAEGFQVGHTLVRDYVQEHKRRHSEVFIPLPHHCGDEAQIDFFEVLVDIEQVRRKAFLFLMRLMYSGTDFFWLYDNCEQIAFFDGHVRGFAHFRGVPHRCVYDNLSLAVKRIVLPERDLTQRFIALQSHYLFEPCFARPGVGHDKGGVESRGKNLRYQQFTPIPQGPSLAAIAQVKMSQVEIESHTKTGADGKTKALLLKEEQSRMLPLPPNFFEARQLNSVSISSKSTFQLGGACYSVPTRWARLHANVWLGVVDLRVECKGESIILNRIRAGQKAIQYRHYLPELAKKPQAVRQVAGELLKELGAPYDKLWRLLVDRHGPKDAARLLSGILGAIVEDGEEVVREALLSSLATDRIDLLALAKLHAASSPAIEVPTALAQYEIESGDLSLYDTWLKGGDQ